MRDHIVSWFQANYPDTCQAMMDTTHTYKHTNPNKYHAEGTVWTHTMMVMTWLEATQETSKEVLLLTALLHDIGKPSTKEFISASETKPDRYSFKGHEGVSTMSAVQILKHYQVQFQLSKWDLGDALYLISTHGSYIPEGCYLEPERRAFRNADKCGAVRRVDENNPSAQYQPYKQAKRSPKHGKDLIILTGLPGSGKSTYTNSLEGYTVVSRDSLIMQQAPDPDNYNEAYEYWHSSDENKAALNKHFNKMVTEATKSDKVVIDMTMLSVSSRRKMLNIFSSHIAHSVVLLPSADVLEARAEQRQGKTIPDYVIHNMARSFIIPTIEEGFNDVEIIIT